VTNNRVCVVLPTFNDSKNIVPLVRAILEACPSQYDLDACQQYFGPMTADWRNRFALALCFAQIAKMKIIEIPAEYLARSLGESISNFFKMFGKYTAAAIRLKISGRKRYKKLNF
jgi:hypothetical protein